VKKTVFFKTFFGFSKLDISWTFINVQFLIPFLLFGIELFTFSKKKNSKYKLTKYTNYIKHNHKWFKTKSTNINKRK